MPTRRPGWNKRQAAARAAVIRFSSLMSNVIGQLQPRSHRGPRKAVLVV